MLHYNFPPYSVGEVGRFGSPGPPRDRPRQARLARAAGDAAGGDDFPYTIRVVSDITESNGSSSMATVCGGSLSMMDAGVPLKAPVAGIAMGLILEGKDFAVITDILGDEDHLGDMDFKVAGTANGITSLQMDIKVAGITEEIMKHALAQAKDGRTHILGEMAKALTTRPDRALGPRAADRDDADRGRQDPRGHRHRRQGHPRDRRGDRRQGRHRRRGHDQDRLVPTPAAIEKARELIHGIVDEPEVGTIYTGKVANIVDFGAFVTFFGKDGLVHVSEIKNERVENPRRPEGRPGGQGQAPGLRPARQGPPVDAAVDQETGKEKVDESAAAD